MAGRGLLAAALLIAGSVAAAAHVTVQPNEAVAGTYFQTALNVSHGCEGSATVAIRVKLPDGVLSVKPQQKPGWTIEIKMRALQGPLPSLHGRSIAETVDEVAWRGGSLPDNLYDTFGLLMRLPDAPGRTLYFPVVQECEHGVHRWIEIPETGQGGAEQREPAPAVRLKPNSP